MTKAKVRKPEEPVNVSSDEFDEIDEEFEAQVVDKSRNVSPEYQELIAEEEEADKPFLEILNYVESSEMMTTKMSDGKELTLDRLRNWDAQYGKIYVSKITDDPIIYVWKPLMRLEYQRMIGTAKESGTTNWNDDFIRQKDIVKTCLLFPEPTDDFIRNTRAGILTTLEQQISFKSGFISEQTALSSIDVIG